MIIAFDPGGTTGIATFMDDRFHQTEFHSSFYSKPHSVFWNMLNNKDIIPEVIIIERFLHRSQTNTVYDGLEYQGLLQLWAEEKNIFIEWQNKTDARKFWTDDKLKKLGLYIPNKDHAMDATGHLLRYLERTGSEFVKSNLEKLKV